jgi:hypothetical protein
MLPVPDRQVLGDEAAAYVKTHLKGKAKVRR